MGLKIIESEDRNLNVSVYIVKQMSKQWRKFSQPIDPEDRNTERCCKVMCLLFVVTGFPRHSLDLAEESLPTTPR